MLEAVLDASAVLAFLQGEPGGEAVASVLPVSCISSVNIAEVVSKFVERGMSDHAAFEAVGLLPLEVVPFGVDSAQRTGALHRRTKGRNVSLGDRACLSLAQDRGLPALTTDRAWTELSLGIEIQAIR